jgi:hypothetical protein
MVIPAVMLVVLALVVMRALMSVVAHEDSAAPAPSTTLDTVSGTPAPELRARADDGVRAFLDAASASSPPAPAPSDATVRAGGPDAWLLMPAAEPEMVGEHESHDDRARTSRS